MDFQWMHKCVKCSQIVKQIMKRNVENLYMEMTKQGETPTLQSLIVQSHPARIVISFFQDLLRMCSKWTPKPFEIEACRCLWRQHLQERGFKKTRTKKVC
jgi:hypothetical protein